VRCLACHVYVEHVNAVLADSSYSIHEGNRFPNLPCCFVLLQCRTPYLSEPSPEVWASLWPAITSSFSMVLSSESLGLFTVVTVASASLSFLLEDSSSGV